MRTCDSCKHMEGRDWRTIPRNGDIPEVKIRTGHCRLLPPRALSDTQSSFAPLYLGWKCGQHSFGWRGFWRAVERLFTRED
jgi:hypothetical protein